MGPAFTLHSMFSHIFAFVWWGRANFHMHFMWYSVTVDGSGHNSNIRLPVAIPFIFVTSGYQRSYPWLPDTSGFVHICNIWQPVAGSVHIRAMCIGFIVHSSFTLAFIFEALPSQCTAHFQLHLRLHICSAFTGIAHFPWLYPWHLAVSVRLRSYSWHPPTSVHIHAMCSGFTVHSLL